MSEVVSGVVAEVLETNGVGVTETEAPKTEPVKPPVADKVSSKFAALARKEQLVKSREREFEAKVAEFEKRSKEFEAKASRDPEAEIKAAFKKNPIKWAEENGYSYQDLITMGLANSEPTPEMVWKQKYEELEQKVESRFEKIEREKQEKELADKESEANNLKLNLLSNIQTFIESHADEYELIKLHGDYESVFETCAAYAAEHGVEPDMAVAARQVEAYYEEQVNRIKEAKKFKSQPTQISKQTAPTLSNTDTTTVPLQSDKKLTREQLIQQATSLIKWDE